MILSITLLLAIFMYTDINIYINLHVCIHLYRMDDLRLLRQVLFGELANGTQLRCGRPKLQLKDILKNDTSCCGLPGWEITTIYK